MHCVALAMDATKVPVKGSPEYTKIMEMKDQIDARGEDLNS